MEGRALTMRFARFSVLLSVGVGFDGFAIE
jgi:hypothetical protein